jgi:myosin heavy chain 6/7
VEELRREQDNYKNAESVRKSLEIEIREITVRLEEAEAFAQREGKRLVAKLQARVHDLEVELDAEQRRGRDVIAENRKLQRMLQELRAQADEDHRLVTELTDQVNSYVTKITILKRQLTEAEEVVQITMSKYRKAQQMLEDTERRAETAEKNITSTVHITRHHITGGPGSRARSMSVSRESSRVIRA